MTIRTSLFSRALAAALFLLLALPLRAQTNPDPFYTLTLDPPIADGYLGWAASGFGDLDQDGVNELAFGLPGVSNGAGGVFFASGTLDEFGSLLSPNAEAGGSFGFSLGRIDRPGLDGVARLGIGAPLETTNVAAHAGRAYILSVGGLVETLQSPASQSGGRFGWSIAGAGDMVGDGVADLVIGAPGETFDALPAGCGRAYVVSFTGTTLSLTSPDPRTNGNFGHSVSGLGDVTADGFDDVIVGAPGEGTDVSNSGFVHLFQGGAGAFLGSRFSPNPEMDGFFGWAVAGTGDVDGDGIPDFIVGAPGEDGGRGRVYLYTGVNGDLLATLEAPTGNTRGFGFALQGLPDIDGDGHADFVVGAPDQAEINRGRAFVYSGRTHALLTRLRSPQGVAESASFGYAVGVTDDVTGDGLPDLLVGSPGEDPGATDGGQVYIFASETFVPVANEPSGADVPSGFALGAAYPNPFNPSATVPFTLVQDGDVRLAVYDALGREVAVLAQGRMAAGAHTAFFDGTSLPSGTYLVRLTAGTQIQTQRVTLLK